MARSGVGILAATTVLVLGACSPTAQPSTTQPSSTTPATAPGTGAATTPGADGSSEGGTPGVATAVVRLDGGLEVEVAGLRRVDAPQPVAEADPWHLGSLGKAMTATLAAVLVEDGVVAWDLAAGDVLGDVDPAAPLASATLEQLLTHTAGVASDLPAAAPRVWDRLWQDAGRDVVATRAWAAAALLDLDPEFPPGTGFAYANAGYLVAGAMLEAATGRSWEDLMVERLFRPLGMACGFGAPEGDVPWGHVPGDPPRPVAPGPAADNPPGIGPAGAVHCDLAGWAAFVRLHLAGASGASALLPPEAFDRLHAPPPWLPGSGYAYGWLVDRLPDGRRLLAHTGSNTMWTATAWLLPDDGVAHLAVTNVGDGAAVLDERLVRMLRDG